MLYSTPPTSTPLETFLYFFIGTIILLVTLFIFLEIIFLIIEKLFKKKIPYKHMIVLLLGIAVASLSLVKAKDCNENYWMPCECVRLEPFYNYDHLFYSSRNSYINRWLKWSLITTCYQ